RDPAGAHGGGRRGAGSHHARARRHRARDARSAGGAVRGVARGPRGRRVPGARPRAVAGARARHADAAPRGGPGARRAGGGGGALGWEWRREVVVVRAAGRALSAQPIDPGTPVEFVVGLERNQLLLGLLRKLEVWDAVSARPLLRLQLQLPPPPRRIGAAHG